MQQPWVYSREKSYIRSSIQKELAGDGFLIRSNGKLYEVLNVIDIIQRINIQVLRWLGFVVRMKEQAPSRLVSDACSCFGFQGCASN